MIKKSREMQLHYSLMQIQGFKLYDIFHSLYYKQLTKSSEATGADFEELDL